MIGWFKKLNDTKKIAIAAIIIPIIASAIGWILVNGLFKKGKTQLTPPANIVSSQQSGNGNTQLTNIGDGPGNLASRDVIINNNTDDDVLNKLIQVTDERGQLKNENKHLQEQISELEKELSFQQIMLESAERQTPHPSQQAKNIATQITEDNAGPYALALKAIAEGNPDKANMLLDDSQEFLDTIQSQTKLAQIKIYQARMQNAYYAGRYFQALEYAEELEPLIGYNSALANNIAFIFRQNAKYTQAEQLYKHALRLAKHPLSMNKLAAAVILNNLANLFSLTDRQEDAEPLFERALAIDEKTFGPDHPNVAVNYNNLAGLYRATGRLEEAEPLFERALKILENPDGEPLPSYSVVLNNLAGLYQDMERLKDAEPLYERAIAIDEKSLGPDHPKVATYLNNLARLYKTTGRLKDAELLLERAIAIDEKSYRPDHPDVAITLNNMAGLYQESGRFEDAKSLYKRAMGIYAKFREQTGHEHPNFQLTVNNYIGLLKEMGVSEEEISGKIR